MRVNDIISQNHFNIIIMKKVCIVTGGSSGIGLSIVKLFLDNNYQVFNLDITASSIGSFCYCDITDVTQVNDIISNIAKEHAIDVLVSNAGIHFSGAIENTSEADLERVFNINVKGAYAAIKAVLPAMKAQQNGAIILMSSDQALIAKHNSFAYNLSKAALASMAKTTALDYAQFNIRANEAENARAAAAAKAEVHAEEAALQPLGRLGKAEEVAELVHFLASDKAKFITGSLQVIDGGYTAQ